MSKSRDRLPVDDYVRCYEHNYGGYKPCLACENERLREVLEDMSCAYHDVRDADKGICHCRDCKPWITCDCPRCEALGYDRKGDKR